jgi:hypothetical protein
MNEPIYAIDLFYDRPIEGIASFEGNPHHFRCEFDGDADEYGDVYCLTPVSAPTLTLVIEKQQIWLRWKSAFRAGRVSLDTHPALPEDRLRYNELHSAIDRAIKDVQIPGLRARAKFLPDGTVEWTKIP